MQVKFCGFTELADVRAAVKMGADAIGLVFYPPSPRAVTPEQAVRLSQAVPAFTSVVALVVNMSEPELVSLAQTVPFDVIQFHGDESPDLCQQHAAAVNKRWIKALRIDQQTDTLDSIHEQIDAYARAGASSILLDAYHKAAYGGTGQRFDWSLIPSEASLPIVLAGGLTPDNVAGALSLPIAAVDVSGGIEYAKGRKDAEKMQRFMTAVRA